MHTSCRTVRYMCMLHALYVYAFVRNHACTPVEERYGYTAHEGYMLLCIKIYVRRRNTYNRMCLYAAFLSIRGSIQVYVMYNHVRCECYLHTTIHVPLLYTLYLSYGIIN